jgi:beta-glucanase (GH16 family)
MRLLLLVILLFSGTFIFAQVSTLSDNFEGGGNITSWFGDDCGMDNQYANPNQSGINNSATVLKYADVGGQYANIRFDAGSNFNLTSNSKFSLKIYVPSSGITGNQNNQISLKLQDGLLPESWTTQCEIIKPIVLNQWQVVSFDFANDAFININSSSSNPIFRPDFNRIVIQINGENNNANVLAYLDDFLYEFSNQEPIFNHLVWSDEFDGNGAINTSNWFQQTKLIINGNSWANGEIQHYTNRQVNSFVSNGSLKILAKKETFTDQGKTKQYTSARLNSKFAFTYGRVEVRAKLPFGSGTFPAIWMLGKNIIEQGSYWTNMFGTVGWPACGEIDIIEHWGQNQNFVQSAIHTPSSFGSTVNLGGQTIGTVSTQFHTYALEWTSEKLVFSVDNVVHYIYNPTIKDESTWPFNAQQYLLLNVAILPNIAANFTQSAMEVDFVRVYQESPLSAKNQNKLNNISIFPNPVSDQFTIQIPEQQLGAQATIISIMGQECKTYALNAMQNTIDLAGLRKGIYIVRIESQTGVSTFNISKD